MLQQPGQCHQKKRLLPGRAVEPSLNPDDDLAEAIRLNLLECHVLQGCPSTEADQHVNVPSNRVDINVCPGSDNDLAEAIRMSLLEGQAVPLGQEAIQVEDA